MLTDLVATEAVLKKARCPEDVFGQLGGDDLARVLEALRHSYRQVIGAVHPDKYTGQPDAVSRAQALVGQLTEWRTRAEEKIHAKTYGDNKPHEPKHVDPPASPQIIETPKRKYIVTDRLAQGDLADLYRCAYTQDGKEHQAVFKIAQSAADNDLLDSEHKILSAMYPLAQPEEKFYRWLHKELKEPGHVIFEGAQGVLLDQDWGFHPHTTWSECTFANAQRLLAGGGGGRVERLGVLRAYHTRHGAGPFPTESAEFEAFSADDHNRPTPWQHGFRSGAFDLVLARYALEVIGGCDGLVLTHVDKIDKLKEVAVCHSYDQPLLGQIELLARHPTHTRPFGSAMERLPLGSCPPAIPDLLYQEELGRLLAASRPRCSRLQVTGGMRYALQLSEALETPLMMVSTGPTEKDKAFVGCDWIDGWRAIQPSF
jgi:hypothetical protein